MSKNIGNVDAHLIHPSLLIHYNFIVRRLPIGITLTNIVNTFDDINSINMIQIGDEIIAFMVVENTLAQNMFNLYSGKCIIWNDIMYPLDLIYVAENTIYQNIPYKQTTISETLFNIDMNDDNNNYDKYMEYINSFNVNKLHIDTEDTEDIKDTKDTNLSINIENITSPTFKKQIIMNKFSPKSKYNRKNKRKYKNNQDKKINEYLELCHENKKQKWNKCKRYITICIVVFIAAMVNIKI